MTSLIQPSLYSKIPSLFWSRKAIASSSFDRLKVKEMVMDDGHFDKQGCSR